MLELATVAFAQPGEMQPERDFNMQGEDTSADRIMGRPSRRGRNWFSFDLPVDPTHPMTLVVSYYSDEWRKRTFDIQVEGQKVGEQTIEKGGQLRAALLHLDMFLVDETGFVMGSCMLKLLDGVGAISQPE